MVINSMVIKTWPLEYRFATERRIKPCVSLKSCPILQDAEKAIFPIHFLYLYAGRPPCSVFIIRSIDSRVYSSCWITNKPSAKSMERFSAVLRLPQETKSSHRYILSGSMPYHAVFFISAYLLRLERKTPKQHTHARRADFQKIISPFLRRSEMLGLKRRSNEKEGKKKKYRSTNTEKPAGDKKLKEI